MRWGLGPNAGVGKPFPQNLLNAIRHHDTESAPAELTLGTLNLNIRMFEFRNVLNYLHSVGERVSLVGEYVQYALLLSHAGPAPQTPDSA